MVDQRFRVYRFALDPTRTQCEAFGHHAGAARWAYNYGLAVKLEALRRHLMQVDELVTLGWTQSQAVKLATVKVPSKGEIQREWNRLKGDDTKGVDGVSPWWRTVSTYAFQSAWMDLDQAWKNWTDSLAGRRAGRPMKKPRFKKKNRCRDSFRLFGSIHLVTYRRLQVPRLGRIRLHGSGKRLQQALNRGAAIKSVTISRGGHRWYATVLVDEPVETPARATRRQRKAGRVGVDFGIYHLAVLSDGTRVNNPRHLRHAHKRLVNANRKLCRAKRGSANWQKAAAKLGRIHHEVAERRRAHLHQVTKQLASGWSTVAVEDLDVLGLTRSARGTVEKPGRSVRAKSGLNRSILDAAPREFRRQLEYKTAWYGSQLALCDQRFPSSKTCSACGEVKAKLPLADRMFNCEHCGLVLDRDVNAARNIAAAAVVAPDGGETLNARPPLHAAVVSNDAGRPRRSPTRPPRRSDPPAVLHALEQRI